VPGGIYIHGTLSVAGVVAVTDWGDVYHLPELDGEGAA
jgi:hypothetical protein